MRSLTRVLLVPVLLAIVPAIAAGHVALDAPNGGEVFAPGDIVTIRWHIYISHALQNWDLWYSTTNGTTLNGCADQPGFVWIPIEMDVTPTCFNAGGSCFAAGGCQMEYAWTVPDGIASDAVKIRVRMDNASTDYYDVSNQPFSIQAAAGIGEVRPVPAQQFVLQQNRPNPFNPMTFIEYVLAEDAIRVRLVISDAQGRLIRVLAAGPQAAGRYAVVWDGTDSRGAVLPSGVYFYALEVNAQRVTRKLLLAK